MGGFGEIRRLRQRAGLGLIEDGLALADGRCSWWLWLFHCHLGYLARRFGVAIIQHQGQSRLGLFGGSGNQDRGESESRTLIPYPRRQQKGEVVARLLGTCTGCDRRSGKALGERVDLRRVERFGFHGRRPSGVGDVGGMPEGGDRVDHRAPVADRGAVSLRFGQGRELLLRPIARGVRPRAATKWVALCRQNSSWDVRGFIGASGALRWLQSAAETKRDQRLCCMERSEIEGFPAGLVRDSRWGWHSVHLLPFGPQDRSLATE